MILHLVMLEPSGPGAMEAIAEAMTVLATLPAQIDGLTDFRHGPNRDFEQKSQHYPYGFLCSFADKAALEAYTINPDHRRAGGMLVGACRNGAEGIFVVDLEV